MNAADRAAAAHRHTDAGPDQIVCLLCGETYRAITHLHLRRVHKLEGEHPILDYKERFGLRVACCEEVCERAKEVQVARHTRAGRHWTKARLLRELRRRRGTPHGLAYSRAPDALRLAARRAFGSWDAALLAAGIEPAAHRLSGLWCLARLKAAILQHARSEVRMSAAWARQKDPELHAAAYRIAGNWTAALRAAGLDVRQHREPKRWALERVTAWVRSTHAAGGDIRSCAAPSGALQRVARETRGVWSEYVESLGIPYPGQKKRRDWSDAAVLRAIRQRHRAGRALNWKGVVRDVGQGLCHQARKRFGSWEAAVEAAGIDSRRSRLTRRWTREIVITAIRERAQLGKSLRRVDVEADDVNLVKAAQRKFPSSWNRAVEAAGLATPVRRGASGRVRRRGRGD